MDHGFIDRKNSDTRIRARTRPLRYDIRIQREAHKSVRRSLSRLRRTLSPELRRGEAARNSARLPVRFVFRSHSSAATITTALRALRVTIWRPRDNAQYKDSRRLQRSE